MAILSGIHPLTWTSYETEEPISDSARIFKSKDGQSGGYGFVSFQKPEQGKTDPALQVDNVTTI
jgi:hypothetical protein